MMLLIGHIINVIITVHPTNPRGTFPAFILIPTKSLREKSFKLAGQSMLAIGRLPAPPEAPVIRAGMVMLEIIGLSKSYKEIKAAIDINLKVPDGQILGLIGPNGSGKTTTIRSALTLLDWDTGTVKVNGHDIVEDPVEARKGLGYIPDDPSLYYGLTVWQHIAFMARAHRAENWEARAEELLHRFDLTEKKNEFVRTLSKGQTQKCWATCVFVTKPMVVLMDEPITGMDPRGVHVFKDLLNEMKARGGCGLVSSHQLHLVEDVCDRIALISKGRIVLEGDINELKAKMKMSPDKDLEELYLKITEVYDANEG